MLGFQVQNLLESAHLLEVRDANARPRDLLMRPSSGYDFFDPSSGMRGFEVQNVLETLLANRASVVDGSAGENAQMHPYQGCLGARCKTS